MTAAREQRCTYCGAPLGHFAHSERYDGPLACAAADCSRQAADDERDQGRADDEDARERASADDFARYR